MARSRLHELSEHGVSVWVDSLSREMLETGHLARLIDDDAVVGVTSNPTIFEKALSTGDWYDEQLRAELERTDDTKDVFFSLAVEDIKRACDLLRPVGGPAGRNVGSAPSDLGRHAAPIGPVATVGHDAPDFLRLTRSPGVDVRLRHPARRRVAPPITAAITTLVPTAVGRPRLGTVHPAHLAGSGIR